MRGTRHSACTKKTAETVKYQMSSKIAGRIKSATGMIT